MSFNNFLLTNPGTISSEDIKTFSGIYLLIFSNNLLEINEYYIVVNNSYYPTQ